MPQESMVQEPQAMEKIPSRLKKSPLSIKGLVKWAVPLLLAAAVLVPTGVAVGLETSDRKSVV